MRPTWRCETSTRLCAVPSSTDSSTPPISAASAPSAINSHSSGPSHKAARPSLSPAGPSREGGSTPNAIPQATRTASAPRRMNRAARGASDKVNRGPAGKAKPSSGERTSSAASAIEPRSLFVIKNRPNDRHADRAARHRDMELAPNPRSPCGDERKRNGTAQSSAHVGRRDVTQRGRTYRRVRAFRHLRALPQRDRQMVRQKPDQLFATLHQHIGTRERSLADEILLRLSDRPIEAKVGERHRAVGLLTDDDIALLGPHHMHRLGAVSAASVLLHLAPRRLPDGATEVRGNVDLVAELAGEAHPHEQSRAAADARLAHAHMLERVVV